jgi:hypothetical protein
VLTLAGASAGMQLLQIRASSSYGKLRRKGGAFVKMPAQCYVSGRWVGVAKPNGGKSSFLKVIVGSRSNIWYGIRPSRQHCLAAKVFVLLFGSGGMVASTYGYSVTQVLQST